MEVIESGRLGRVAEEGRMSIIVVLKLIVVSGEVVKMFLLGGVFIFYVMVMGSRCLGFGYGYDFGSDYVDVWMREGMRFYV